MTDHHRGEIEQLFRKFGKGVGSYVYARVGSADIAETITSSVFLTVVQRFDQCRTSPEGWLWSIVKSELARYFRDRRPTESLSAALPDTTISPVEAAERSETQSQMREALALLSEDQQRIIYLKFFQDMANTEIAAALGMSASNVGMVVHRAVRRLRELMEPAALRPPRKPSQA